jgi:hypothetical protein
VKFILTFDGELPSTGNGSRKTEKKWEIRKYFQPQLEELWNVHPALRPISDGYAIAINKGPFFQAYTHHEYQTPTPPHPLRAGEIDLCASIQKGNRLFKPLVRKSFALTCGLKIQFLRKEKPGRVYQGGDLDNRIKTLLDSLSVPVHQEQVISDPTIEDPILCLAEDDSLITSISVETERLLSRPNARESDVHLNIEVDVRVTDTRAYNMFFLGD